MRSERILSCPRERALGRSLVVAVPGLAKTDLLRAIDEALTEQSPRTLTQLGLTTAGRARILQVRVFPVAGGATLLWLDVTGSARAEHALKRSEERLALAAEGANDGLWEWDLRTQELYCLGPMADDARAAARRPASAVPRTGSSGCIADDLAPLKEALDAHLSGKTGSLPARAPPPPRGRHLPPVPVPRRGGARARPAPGADRRIADRHDGAGDRAGAAARRSLPAIR